MENANKGGCKSMESPKRIQAIPAGHNDGCRYGWRLMNNTMEAIKFTFNSVSCGPGSNISPRGEQQTRATADSFKGKSAAEVHQDPSTSQEALTRTGKKDPAGSRTTSAASMHAHQDNNTSSASSMRSIGSFVCRICHNSEQPERYTCLQSLRMWYSHSMSRRALQEDCQMFSLLTLVAFGIVGTILVGIQYYMAQEKHSHSGLATKMWIKGWLVFFLCVTFAVYFTNVYMIARGQLGPWYRWWQSAREIKLILENRKTYHPGRRLRKSDEGDEPQPQATPTGVVTVLLQDAYRNPPITTEDTVFSNPCAAERVARRHALIPTPSAEGEPELAHQQLLPSQSPAELHQDQPQEQVEHDKRNQVAAQQRRF